MAESMDFRIAFKEIMIHEAARDARLRGSLEWLLLGETDLIPIEIASSNDAADLSADIAEWYDLDADDMNRAFELCEDQIMTEAYGGQA